MYLFYVSFANLGLGLGLERAGHGLGLGLERAGHGLVMVLAFVLTTTLELMASYCEVVTSVACMPIDHVKPY